MWEDPYDDEYEDEYEDDLGADDGVVEEIEVEDDEAEEPQTEVTEESEAPVSLEQEPESEAPEPKPVEAPPPQPEPAPQAALQQILRKDPGMDMITLISLIRPVRSVKRIWSPFLISICIDVLQVLRAYEVLAHVVTVQVDDEFKQMVALFEQSLGLPVERLRTAPCALAGVSLQDFLALIHPARCANAMM